MSDRFKVEFKKNKEMFQAVIQALTFVAWSYIIKLSVIESRPGHVVKETGFPVSIT